MSNTPLLARSLLVLSCLLTGVLGCVQLAPSPVGSATREKAVPGEQNDAAYLDSILGGFPGATELFVRLMPAKPLASDFVTGVSDTGADMLNSVATELVFRDVGRFTAARITREEWEVTIPASQLHMGIELEKGVVEMHFRRKAVVGDNVRGLRDILASEQSGEDSIPVRFVRKISDTEKDMVAEYSGVQAISMSESTPGEVVVRVRYHYRHDPEKGWMALGVRVGRVSEQ